MMCRDPVAKARDAILDQHLLYFDEVLKQLRAGDRVRARCAKACGRGKARRRG